MRRDLFEYLEEVARTDHDNNRSAALSRAVEDMRDRNAGPFGPENALISDAKQVFRRLGLEHEHDDGGVDWVLPKLGLGVELKTRYGGGQAANRMVAAMAFSVGKGRCTEIVIVGSAAMSELDAQKYSDAAAAFRPCPASFVRIDELPSFLKKRLSDKKSS